MMRTDCSAEVLFPYAKTRLCGIPQGYALNQGGEHGLTTKSPVWGVAKDPLQVPGCVMVLTRFLDGSPIALRYRSFEVFRFVPELWS